MGLVRSVAVGNGMGTAAVAAGLLVGGVGVLAPVAGFAAPQEGARVVDAVATSLRREAQRPLVGLVLSGGGARGLAHVGVIRWLDEQRIPIDLIAGTSMGGLVGGLFATGADHRAMHDLLEGIDWSEALSAEAPYAEKSFRRKEDARLAPATFELGLRDGFKLPPGLDAGHQVGLILDRIAFPYSGLESFDELPTPFACVAVDLRSGDEVVYRGGHLAEALRATMSYPGWFAPVRSGDRVLIDGGVLNNLPTDVMKEMGADLIIAVDLGMRTSQDVPFDSVLDILNGTLSVMMRANSNRNALIADELITPDVSAYGFADFGSARELDEIGYAAAEELAEELGAYALDEIAWERYLAERSARHRAFYAVPEFVAVTGDTVAADALAVATALDHHVGTVLDPDHLDDDLTRVTGWGRYDVVGYAESRVGAARGLAIDVQAKTYGPPFVRPIVDLRGSEFGEALFSFGGRFTFYDLVGVNSEWRTDATYGQRTELATELFVPLGTAGFFVAPRAIAGRRLESLYSAGERVAEYLVEQLGGGADLGFLFGPRSQIRLGAEVAMQRAEVSVGDPLLPLVDGTAGAVRASWSFDGTDSPLIPTRGLRADAEATWRFASPDATRDYYQARLYMLAAGPLGGRFSFVGTAQGGATFDATAPPLQQFVLGGPLRLGALRAGELRGDNFFLGQAGVLWGLAGEGQLSFVGKFYLAALYEIGDAFDDDASPFQDVTLGIAGETPLGAVFVGGAVGEERRGGFFFAVGRLF